MLHVRVAWLSAVVGATAAPFVGDGSLYRYLPRRSNSGDFGTVCWPEFLKVLFSAIPFAGSHRTTKCNTYRCPQTTEGLFDHGWVDGLQMDLYAKQDKVLLPFHIEALLKLVNASDVDDEAHFAARFWMLTSQEISDKFDGEEGSKRMAEGYLEKQLKPRVLEGCSGILDKTTGLEKLPDDLDLALCN